MAGFDEYLKGILKQIYESYTILSELDDKPGDLEIIKIELLKINGLFHVLIRKIDSSTNQSDDYVTLLKRSKHYIENYNFETEIDTLSNLYSNDPNRVKNIRLKIIEALQDKKLVELVENIFNSK